MIKTIDVTMITKVLIKTIDIIYADTSTCEAEDETPLAMQIAYNILGVSPKGQIKQNGLHTTVYSPDITIGDMIKQIKESYVEMLKSMQ